MKLKDKIAKWVLENVFKEYLDKEYTYTMKNFSYSERFRLNKAISDNQKIFK